MLNKFIIAGLIFLNTNTFAGEMLLNNVVANYAFFYKNISAGTMQLKIQSKNNEVQISAKYDGNFLAELANRGYREEISLLEKEKHALKVKKYSYLDEKMSYEAIFEETNKVKILEKNFQKFYLNSDESIFDPMSMLLHLMMEYPNVKDSYSVISKKKLKIYNYLYKDGQSIQINNKEYNGFSAEYVSGNKTNFFLFSKDHNNLMVLTSIKKKGKEKIRIELRNIEYTN